MKAIWNNQVIAESDETIIVEGNHYFPPESLHSSYFQQTERTSICPWKGTARYFTITVDGQNNENAAWSYPEAKDKAKNIEGYVAFWNGVQVE